MKFTHVPINQTAGATTVLIAAAADKFQYLFALVGTIGTEGTLQIVDSAGTALTGAFTLGKGYPFVMIHPTKDTAPTGGEHYGLSIVTSQAFDGYAVIGTE